LTLTFLSRFPPKRLHDAHPQGLCAVHGDESAWPLAWPRWFIRVPDTPKLNATNRYFDAAPGAIAADLAGLGLEPLAAASPVDFANVRACYLVECIQQYPRVASSSIRDGRGAPNPNSLAGRYLFGLTPMLATQKGHEVAGLKIRQIGIVAPMLMKSDVKKKAPHKAGPSRSARTNVRGAA
jgi:hypothetical protein